MGAGSWVDSTEGRNGNVDTFHYGLPVAMLQWNHPTSIQAQEAI